MGRPRRTKVDAIKFTAHRDGESKEFSSRREALAYTVGAKRNVRVEETYFKARGWELAVERCALPDQIGDEPNHKLGGVRLVEREFTIKGDDKDALLKAAETRREASYLRSWHELHPERMHMLPPAARVLAARAMDLAYVPDERLEIEAVDKRRLAAEREAARAAEAAIPSVGKLFEQELARKVKNGRVQGNTADIYRYQANSLRTPVLVDGAETPLWDVQVHRLDETMIQNWLASYAAEPTRFGRPPSSKTIINTLQHLRDAGKALGRDPKHRQHGQPFAIINTLLEDVRSGRRDADGWRSRARLSNEEVARVVAVCETELEWATLGLSLAGSRPPSELVAVEWDHLEQDEGGNTWWHVSASGIEHVGGRIEIRAHTKTKDVDYRQLSVPRKTVLWIEARRGNSKFVLGEKVDGREGDVPMRPRDLVEIIEGLLRRAGVLRPGISAYSLRHTVSDEVERLLGRTARDLVLHGKRDRTTGGMHYSHAERDRRRAELTFDGQPYGEHMVWAHPPKA